MGCATLARWLPGRWWIACEKREGRTEEMKMVPELACLPSLLGSASADLDECPMCQRRARLMALEDADQTTHDAPFYRH